MYIEIFDETKQLNQQQIKFIEDILLYAAQHIDIEQDTEMSVTIVDNQKIKEINRQYRKKDAPTDVISFAMEDESEEDAWIDWTQFEGIPLQLGDIFISIDKVKEQAETYGHSEKRELGFLCVHGFLHLNGYDHLTQEDEKEMFTLQDKILEGFDLER